VTITLITAGEPAADKPQAGRRMSAGRHFSRSHPLAQVASDRCEAVHGRRGPHQQPCGPCWEHAVRTDALFAAEWDLPAELVAEPDLIDEIAVDRACGGGSVRLTVAELALVVEQLRRWGLTWDQIGRRIGRNGEALCRRVREHTATRATATAAMTPAADVVGGRDDEAAAA
jgi:hypothetical protein